MSYQWAVVIVLVAVPCLAQGDRRLENIRRNWKPFAFPKYVEQNVNEPKSTEAATDTKTTDRCAHIIVHRPPDHADDNLVGRSQQEKGAIQQVPSMRVCPQDV